MAATKTEKGPVEREKKISLTDNTRPQIPACERNTREREREKRGERQRVEEDSRRKFLGKERTVTEPLLLAINRV